MWADHETETDLLGFGHLVDAVVALASDETLLPATIGVYGDWGSGKSSLLRMASRRLAGDKGVLVLSFNGWLFEGYEDARSVLLGTIVDGINAKRTRTARAKSLGLRLLRRVDWLRVAGAAAKVGGAFVAAGPVGGGIVAGGELAAAAKKVTEELGELDEEKLGALLESEVAVGLRENVRAFRHDFDELLNETSTARLVVVIDDLDRCLPDTIIETLEAIRLFVFVPRTVFLIGADDRLVKYAVRRRFPELPGERSEVGRDYLEKLVQFSVTVPPLGRAEVQSYMALLFMQKGASAEEVEAAREKALATESLAAGWALTVAEVKKIAPAIDAETLEGVQLAERIAGILASGFSGNPRQCKRFLNTLLLRLSMGQSRHVDLRQTVLAKLMLLAAC